MNKSYSYAAHNICLISVVILASGVLSVPFKTSGGNSLITFLTSAALGVAALVILSIFINFILSRGGSTFSKIITVVGCAALLFAVCVSTVDAVLSFCRFVSEVMLPQTSRWWVIVCFSAAAVVFGKSRESAILKFSLVTVVLNVAFILLLILFSAGQLSLANLFSVETVIEKDFFAQVFKYFGRIFLPAVSALTFIALANSRIGYSCALSGSALGVALLAVCLMQSIMIFGSGVAATTDYPYMSAVGTITAGSLYTRPDGFAYVMLFASYIVKAGVGVSTAVMLTKIMIKKSRSN